MSKSAKPKSICPIKHSQAIRLIETIRQLERGNFQIFNREIKEDAMQQESTQWIGGIEYTKLEQEMIKGLNDMQSGKARDGLIKGFELITGKQFPTANTSHHAQN